MLGLSLKKVALSDDAAVAAIIVGMKEGKITLAGVVIPVIAVISGFAFSGVFNDELRAFLGLESSKAGHPPEISPSRLENPGLRPNGGQYLLPTTVQPSVTGVNAGNVSVANAIPERLLMEYEDLANRFSEVENSLRRRIGDLHGAEPKPEILSKLTTCRQDLNSAKAAIGAAEADRAKTRLNRARLAVVYLETL